MGLVALGGKGAEIVLAHDGPGRALQALDVERPAERPLEAAAEG